MAHRGLDHIVHLVKDLDKAGAAYAKQGFNVGGRNIHPWGTHNKIIQFDGFFIELLEVAEPEKLANHPFGQFNFELLKQGFEGYSMLVLEGFKDDAGDYKAKGIDGGALSFSRQGAKGKVGFDLAFAAFNFKENRPYPTPNLKFFSCLQHAPELFWDKAVQNPQTISEAVFVSENPSDYAEYFSLFTGVRDFHATSIGLHFALPRGSIRIVDPDYYKAMFGKKYLENPPLSLAALLFKGKQMHFSHNGAEIYVK